jgi:dihydrofolate reductase
VLSSASIIQAMLAAGLVDELRIYLCPELLGSGKRFFDDGLPRSSWHLAGVTTMETGAIGLQYRVQ